MEMENLESQREPSEISLTNRIQNMEGRIAAIEGKTEEMGTTVKGNVIS